MNRLSIKVYQDLIVFFGTAVSFIGVIYFIQLIDIHPPVLTSHGLCEKSQVFGCGFSNIAYQSTVGLFTGTIGGLLAKEKRSGFICTFCVLIIGATLMVNRVLHGESMLSMPLYYSGTNQPAWLTVPIPLVIGGSVGFWLSRVLRKNTNKN